MTDYLKQTRLKFGPLQIKSAYYPDPPEECALTVWGCEMSCIWVMRLKKGNGISGDARHTYLDVHPSADLFPNKLLRFRSTPAGR